VARVSVSFESEVIQRGTLLQCSEKKGIPKWRRPGFVHYASLHLVFSQLQPRLDIGEPNDSCSSFIIYQYNDYIAPLAVAHLRREHLYKSQSYTRNFSNTKNEFAKTAGCSQALSQNTIVSGKEGTKLGLGQDPFTQSAWVEHE